MLQVRAVRAEPRRHPSGLWNSRYATLSFTDGPMMLSENGAHPFNNLLEEGLFKCLVSFAGECHEVCKFRLFAQRIKQRVCFEIRIRKESGFDTSRSTRNDDTLSPATA